MHYARIGFSRDSELQEQVGKHTMGQYQHWLLCQEIDRRLRAELEALEIELTELQRNNAHLLEQQFPPANNMILRVLSAGLNEPVSSINGSSEYTEYSNISSALLTPADEQEFRSESQQAVLQFGNADLEAQEAETISPALLAWSRLPNFGPQNIPETILNTDSPGRQDIQPEMELLPDDMMAFLDEHSQTEPQLELPWWLRNMINSSDQAGNVSSTNPIDQESIRTNWLVERWQERWRRHSPAPPASSQQPLEKTDE